MAQVKVLVVDDSVKVRAGLVAVINSHPELIVCGEAGNGKECIEHVDRLKPEVVVLDISMPVMNGLDAARILRKSHANLSIIICSSFDVSSMRQEAENVGAKGIFSKSEPLEGLLDCIRSARAKPARQ